jgi:hypothetical protein
MAQTKKQEEEVTNAMLQDPPKTYKEGNYLFSITGCPGYKGYIPEDLNYEVCRYCGSIHYYH